MILPPLPGVYKAPPPDPGTLPPPPQLEWASLGPEDSVEEPGAIVASTVPPPEAETPMAPPPPPMEEVPQPDGPAHDRDALRQGREQDPGNISRREDAEMAGLWLQCLWPAAGFYR